MGVWLWGGGCEWEGGFGCGGGVSVVWGRWCECGELGVGGCGRWVQVMEHVKIEGVEMKGVYKRLVHIP